MTLSSIGDGVISTDIDGKILSINKAAERLTGWSHKDAIDRPIEKVFNIIDEKTGEPCDSPVGERLVTGKISGWTAQSVLVATDGTRSLIENSGAPIFDSERKIRGAVLVFRDITQQRIASEEQERLQRELHQSQKMDALGNLTGGIAHDFNNILGIIMGNIGLAQSHYEDMDKSRMRKYLDAMQSASERARDLIAQMMLFSRRDQGESHPMDLVPMLKADMKMLCALLPTSIEIDQNYQTDLPKVVIDPVKLQQMLMNLCLNAKDAMNGVGKLSVWLRMSLDIAQECTTCNELLRGDWVELSVTDSGAGIDVETLAHIFEPFYTTKEVGKGTGLGLAVVDSIMKSFNGHIIVQSARGKGTTFRLLFNPAQPEDSLALEGDISGEVSKKGGGQSILVVDDEPELALVISEMLELYGYKSTAITSSTEALKLFESNPGLFDLVITDQTMPELTGIEMAAWMRQTSPELPIILTTGYSDTIGSKEADEHGVGFLKKPVEADNLAKCVAEFL